MNSISYFKNFNMGKELEICGEFIYESAREMYALRNLYEHFNINKILYSGSVRIERLQKILLSMFLFDSEDDIKNAPKCFREHNHIALNDKIKQTVPSLTLKKNHVHLLELFQDYYNNHRYGEFRPNYSSDDLLRTFFTFFSRISKTEYELYAILAPRELVTLKKQYINLIGEISHIYFNLIQKRATELGIFTTELSYTSNAYKVFVTLEDEKLIDMIQFESLSIKELIVYLSKEGMNANIGMITRSITPIDFDPAMINEYLVDITRLRASTDLTDMVYSHYSDYESNKEKYERLNLVDLIGDPDVLLADDQD